VFCYSVVVAIYSLNNNNNNDDGRCRQPSSPPPCAVSNGSSDNILYCKWLFTVIIIIMTINIIFSS